MKFVGMQAVVSMPLDELGWGEAETRLSRQSLRFEAAIAP